MLVLKKLPYKRNEEKVIVTKVCVFMCCHYIFVLKCFLLVFVPKTSFFYESNPHTLSIVGAPLRTALYSKMFV